MIYRPSDNTDLQGCSYLRGYQLGEPAINAIKKPIKILGPDQGRHMINESEPCFARTFSMCSAKCGPRIVAWRLLSKRTLYPYFPTENGVARKPPRKIFDNFKTNPQIRRRFYEAPRRQRHRRSRLAAFGRKGPAHHLPMCPMLPRTHPGWIVPDSFFAPHRPDWTGKSRQH